MHLPKEKKRLLIIIFIAFFLRLFIAFKFEATGDSGGWRQMAKTGLEHKDYGYGITIYNDNCTVCPNIPPLTYHYLIFSKWVYLNLNPLHLPQWGFYKLISVVSDTGIIIVIYYLAKKFKFKKPLTIASFYAFSPIALEVAGYHGQRGSVWLLFSLLSAIFIEKKRYLVSGLLMGIGLSIKMPGILLLPLFFFMIPKNKDRLLYATVVPLTFFYFNLPETFTSTYSVLKQNLLYKGWFGWWGFSGIVSKIGLYIKDPELIKIFDPINRIFLYIAIISSSFYLARKKINIFLSTLIVIMIIFVFTPSFAFQYLIWPLPLIVLFKDKFPVLFKFYMIYGTFFAMNFYGIFGIKFLEYIFLTIPREYVYYKIPGLSYPMDLGFPIWIFFICFLFIILKDKKLKLNKKYDF